MNEALDPKWGELNAFHDPYALANFQARSSDVLITTAPKAGTTWMQHILHQLKTGGDASFHSIFDEVPWLEWPIEGVTWQERLAGYEKINAPRIFKTHCTYEQTPGVDTVKVVLTSRDPRDCCISFHHHLNDLTDEVCEKFSISRSGSFDEYFEDWMDFGAWFRNVKSWWPHYNDDNVLWLRYEDMKADFKKSIDQIIHFLDWSVSDEQQLRAMEYSSFEWMKAHSEKFTVHSGHEKPMFKPGGFIRKGQVGDHKNTLSSEQSDRIIARAKSELEPACFSFLGLE